MGEGEEGEKEREERKNRGRKELEKEGTRGRERRRGRSLMRGEPAGGLSLQRWARGNCQLCVTLGENEVPHSFLIYKDSPKRSWEQKRRGRDRTGPLA